MLYLNVRGEKNPTLRVHFIASHLFSRVAPSRLEDDRDDYAMSELSLSGKPSEKR